MSGLLRWGLPAMWKVNPLWAFFSVALISLGTLVVACRQVVVGGGRWKVRGMDGGMNTGPPWSSDRVVQILSSPSSLTLKPTSQFRDLLCPHLSSPLTHHHPKYTNKTTSLLYHPATLHPLSLNPQLRDLLMRFPAWPTDGRNTEQWGFAAWRASRVASEGWQLFTMERVLLLHCAQNLPDTASTPTPLGFNCSPLAVSLCVKATIPTDSSWALCQGMKDMIDNNGVKTCSTVLLSGFSQWAVSGTSTASTKT